MQAFCPERGGNRAMEVSVVMPCLNEAETVGACVKNAVRALDHAGLDGEVVVADNGSSDGSRRIAANAGARIVEVRAKGYGAALMGGIEAARGTFVIMGDADASYDFGQITEFLQKLRDGYDLVMGNRFRGGIQRGAMPFLHRYFGNPMLTFLGRFLFRSRQCGDFHCGLRAFRRDAVQRLNLRTTGMEFATEMVVKSSLHGLRITEIPTTLSPDGRTHPPHLHTWRDGWRHLRFMLLYSPTWLFLVPGVALILAGSILGGWLLTGRQVFGGVAFDVHTLLYCGVAVIVGFQAVVFHLFSKVFAINEGLLPEDHATSRLSRIFNLEIGLLLGCLFFAGGIGATVYAVRFWGSRSFGRLDPREVMRLVIPAAVLIMLGCQTVFSSFFLSILSLKRK
ncbi:MAG: glycosyltransferase [Chitinivibrionales bacterium]|nr:glycosyltransferase [Chitinivibrionales bacterium]MBD3397252.1 glycosyltransferase [Chitinivibrionales bacterium]